MFRQNRGASLLEIIVVLVIVGIGTGIAGPRVTANIENQKAKKALETMRTISNAVRLYELNTGTLATSIQQLEANGYLKSGSTYERFGPTPYQYSIARNGPQVSIIGETDDASPYGGCTPTHIERQLTLSFSATSTGQDGNVSDSRGFLTATGP